MCADMGPIFLETKPSVRPHFWRFPVRGRTRCEKDHRKRETFLAAVPAVGLSAAAAFVSSPG